MTSPRGTHNILQPYMSPPTMSPLANVRFLNASWNLILQPCMSTPEFAKLKQFLEEEYKNHTIFPPCDQVFAWSVVAFSSIKVVILGQDPYHGLQQANGLAFSVPCTEPVPPSLKNIYKEVARDIPNFEIPTHGNLHGWVRQGVLLLNSVLTVREGKPGSHRKQGWEEITDYIVKKISDERDGVVFMLWGEYSKQKETLIDQKKHLVLKSSHPSPLSCHRGFLGCGHFSSCNAYLTSKGIPAIDWTSLPKILMRIEPTELPYRYTVYY